MVEVSFFSHLSDNFRELLFKRRQSSGGPLVHFSIASFTSVLFVDPVANFIREFCGWGNKEHAWFCSVSHVGLHGYGGYGLDSSLLIYLNSPHVNTGAAATAG